MGQVVRTGGHPTVFETILYHLDPEAAKKELCARLGAVSQNVFEKNGYVAQRSGYKPLLLIQDALKDSKMSLEEQNKIRRVLNKTLNQPPVKERSNEWIQTATGLLFELAHIAPQMQQTVVPKEDSKDLYGLDLIAKANLNEQSWNELPHFAFAGNRGCVTDRLIITVRPKSGKKKEATWNIRDRWSGTLIALYSGPFCSSLRPSPDGAHLIMRTGSGQSRASLDDFCVQAEKLPNFQFFNEQSIDEPKRPVHIHPKFGISWAERLEELKVFLSKLARPQFMVGEPEFSPDGRSFVVLTTLTGPPYEDATEVHVFHLAPAPPILPPPICNLSPFEIVLLYLAPEGLKNLPECRFADFSPFLFEHFRRGYPKNFHQALKTIEEGLSANWFSMQQQSLLWHVIWKMSQSGHASQKIKALAVLFHLANVEKPIPKPVGKITKIDMNGQLKLMDDLWKEIFSFLSPKELLIIDQTCIRFHNLCQDSKLWQRHVLSSSLISKMGYLLERTVQIRCMQKPWHEHPHFTFRADWGCITDKVIILMTAQVNGQKAKWKVVDRWSGLEVNAYSGPHWPQFKLNQKGSHIIANLSSGPWGALAESFALKSDKFPSHQKILDSEVAAQSVPEPIHPKLGVPLKTSIEKFEAYLSSLPTPLKLLGSLGFSPDGLSAVALTEQLHPSHLRIRYVHIIHFAPPPSPKS